MSSASPTENNDAAAERNPQSPAPRAGSGPSLLDRLLTRLGIDARIYRALLQAYVTMDFRNQQFGRSTGTKATELVTPLFLVIGQNLLITLAACLTLFARVDLFFFTMINLGLAMFVMATSLIVEFNEVVLDPKDLETIGHQPIPNRTYAAARVTNLILYLLVMIVSLILFPALIGVGMRDAAWWYPLLYSVLGLVGGLFTTGLVMLAYVFLLRAVDTSQAQEYLAWVQVLLMLVVGYGGQLAVQEPTQAIQMAAYNLPGWAAFLPPTWFASALQRTPVLPEGFTWPLIAACVAATAAAWVVVVNQLSVAYGRLEGGKPAWRRTELPPLPRPGELGGFFTRALTSTPDERLGFWLTNTMLDREPNIKLRCWPAFAVTLAFLAIGFFSGQLVNPVQEPKATAALTLATIYLLAAVPPTILHNLRYSGDHHAAWVLEASPIENFFQFCQGSLKCVLVRFFVPTLLIMLVTFWLAWRDPLQAFLHTGIAAALVWGSCYAFQAVMARRFPFTEPLARGGSFGPVAPYVGAGVAVGSLLAGLHLVAARNPIWLGLLCAVVVLLAVSARVYAGRVLSRRIPRRALA